MAYGQICKKQCFEKYCSYDQVCQFSALQGTPEQSYLENLTIEGKFINKQVMLLFVRNNNVAKQLLNSTF